MKDLRIILLLIICSCAQIKSPTGGEKDEMPPIIENMVPPNYSTNFSGSKILLEFDEYVSLKDIQEQLLVSPPLLSRPEFSTKGKTVILELQEELEKNTTYTFNLGEGIVDINEGNPLDSNVIVFSTGDLLDSLSIRGNVVNSYTQLPLHCGVLLHRSLEDSAIVKERPQYFTRTDDNGNFELNNLREGTYRLYAVGDIDKNYLWSENEFMAYFDDEISVSFDDSSFHLLSAFLEEPSKQFVKKYESKSHGRVEIVLNKEAKGIELVGRGFSYDTLIVLNDARKDSIICWFQNIRELDDPELIVIDENWTDTLSLGSFEEEEKMEVPGLEFMGKPILKHSPKKALELKFNLPISEIDTSNFLFRFDSLESRFDLQRKNALTYDLKTDWSKGRSANLFLFPGAISDIYSQQNDTTLLRVSILSKEDHSELTLDIGCDIEANYIIELFEGERIEKQENFSDSAKLIWDWLLPGEYELRVIDDRNNNGIWDTGNYFDKIQPEPVKKLSTIIHLRPNWLLDQKWKLKFE